MQHYKNSLLSYWELLSNGRKRKHSSGPAIDAVALGWRRPSNLPIVVRGLLRQPCVRDVYVWHNYPSRRRVPGAINIVSSFNFKCRVRHAIGLALESDYILFMDDDLYFRDNQSDRILSAIDEVGETSVLGAYGMILTEGEKPYSDGTEVHHRTAITPVDIVKGRIHIVSRANLLASWNQTDRFEIGTREKEEDDILLNVGVQLATGANSYVIPLPGISMLPAPHSRHHTADHFSTRDKLILSLQRQGWQTPVSAGRVSGGRA